MSQIKEAIEDIDETRKIIAKIWNTLCDKCNVKECREKKLSASLMDCKTMMQFNACRTYLNQAIAKLEETTEQPPDSDFTKKMREEHKEVYLHRPCQYTTDIYDLCTRLDRSEASRKDLLTACDEGLRECERVKECTCEYRDLASLLLRIERIEAAITKAKEVKI